MKKYATLLLLILTGCPEPVVPNPTPPPADTDKCDVAEANIEALECRDSEGDPMWINRNGERFGDTCRMAQEEGLIFLNPSCVAEAPTCDAINECPAAPHGE